MCFSVWQESHPSLTDAPPPNTHTHRPHGSQVTAARLVMKQVVVREEDNGKTLAVCAEGLATVVFLDEAYRPVRLPAGDRQVFEALRQAAARGKP